MTPDLHGLISQMAAELDRCQQLLLDDRRVTHALATEARAVLDRWGHQPAPPADGDYREDWDMSSKDGSLCFASAILSRLVNGVLDEAGVRWLAAYLQVNSTPQPVAVSVSERLPEPEHRDPAGCCWWFTETYPRPVGPGAVFWELARFCPGSTHWLPAHALPTPEATND